MSLYFELSGKIVSVHQKIQQYETAINQSALTKEVIQDIEQKVNSSLTEIETLNKEVEVTDQIARQFFFSQMTELKQRQQTLVKRCAEMKTSIYLDESSSSIFKELEDLSSRVSIYLKRSEEIMSQDECLPENLSQLNSRISLLSSKISEIENHKSHTAIKERYQLLTQHFQELEKKASHLPHTEDAKSPLIYSSSQHFYLLLNACKSKPLDAKSQNALVHAFHQLPFSFQNRVLIAYGLTSYENQNALIQTPFQALKEHLAQINEHLALPPPPSLETDAFDSWLVLIEHLLGKEAKKLAEQDKSDKLEKFYYCLTQLSLLKKTKNDSKTFIEEAVKNIHAQPQKLEELFLNEIDALSPPSQPIEHPYFLLQVLSSVTQKENETPLTILYRKILDIAATAKSEQEAKKRIQELLNKADSASLTPIFQNIFQLSRDDWKDHSKTQEWGKDHALDNLAVLIGAFHTHLNASHDKETSEFISELISIEHAFQKTLFKEFSHVSELHIKVFGSCLESHLVDTHLQWFKKHEQTKSEAMQGLVQKFLSSNHSSLVNGSSEEGRDLGTYFIRQKKQAETVLNQLKTSVEEKSTPQIAEKLLNQSPLTAGIRSCQCESIPSEDKDELITRASFIREIKEIENLAKKKHAAFFEETNSFHYRLFRAIEIFLTSSSHPLSDEQKTSLNHVCLALKDILDSEYEENTQKMLFSIVLRHFAFRIHDEVLHNYLQLHGLEKEIRERFLEREVHTSTSMVAKNIYQVKRENAAIAKYKPLPPTNAYREQCAFAYDEIFGTQMTAPTTMISLSIRKEMLKIAHLYQTGKGEQARKLFEKLPWQFQRIVYEELHYFTDAPHEDNVGHDAFWNIQGKKATDQQRALAIKNSLSNPKFRHEEGVYLFSQEYAQGSLQIWLSEVKRAIDVLEKDEKGGEKLKNIPKPLVHFYAVLGLIKGSSDCSSGNTFLKMDHFGSEEEKVINFFDFDDERSMPANNDFWHARMWQFGLPQCNMPFDRSTLVLLSDETFVQKINSYHRFNPKSSLEPKTAYDAQKKRLSMICQMCKEELSKPTITLTPRDLFFAIYQNAKEQQYEPRKASSYWSDLRIFEFGIGDMVRDGNYWDDKFNPDNKTFNNLEKLYS